MRWLWGAGRQLVTAVTFTTRQMTEIEPVELRGCRFPRKFLHHLRSYDLSPRTPYHWIDSFNDTDTRTTNPAFDTHSDPLWWPSQLNAYSSSLLRYALVHCDSYYNIRSNRVRQRPSNSTTVSSVQGCQDIKHWSICP
jgi:hypothetical protein